MMSPRSICWQVGQELTEEVNPLEAGLHGAVSLAKGCYIGQETLAKVCCFVNSGRNSCQSKHI